MRNFELRESTRGGMAGRWRNRSASIQVIEPLLDGAVVQKTFRYIVGDSTSKRTAMVKAIHWRDTH